MITIPFSCEAIWIDSILAILFSSDPAFTSKDENSEKFSENYNVNLHFPENQFCTDNGAMIAMSAYLKNNINSTDNSNLKVVPVPNVKIWLIGL